MRTDVIELLQLDNFDLYIVMSEKYFKFNDQRRKKTFMIEKCSAVRIEIVC